MEQVPLLVLGTGIDGLAASLCLAHQGFPVVLLDRGPAPEVGDPVCTGSSGATVLRPWATRILQGLGVLDALSPRCVSLAHYLHGDADSGQVVRRVELGESIRTRYGSPALAVARTDLRTALARACADDEMITVHHECRVATIEDLGDAALVVTEEGTQWRAEALVGADGSSSRVRALLEGVGAGALSPTFVVRRGRESCDTGAADLQVWSSPALQVSRIPVPQGCAELALIMRAELPPAEREWIVSRLDPELRPTVSLLVSREPEQVVAHQRPLARWVRHRVTVLGAAAQPLLPHASEDESQALLDAHALGAAFDRSDGRILPGLEGYESSRASARVACATQVAEFAALSHAEGLTRRLRDRLWAGEPVDQVAELLGG